MTLENTKRYFQLGPDMNETSKSPQILQKNCREGLISRCNNMFISIVEPVVS